MSVGKKRRFEVFKRDGFTCIYCGRKPPATTLEVDHVIPRVDGGDDEMENLVTSCFDCNRGKGAGGLDERAPRLDLVAETARLREREEQLRAYHEAKEEQLERKDAGFNEVWSYWFELWGVTTLNKWETPWENSLRNAVDVLGVADVKDAMRIACDRFTYPSSSAAKYFGGIIRRRLAGADGRLVQCTVCGKDIVLEADQDPHLRWHHTACAVAE